MNPRISTLNAFKLAISPPRQSTRKIPEKYRITVVMKVETDIIVSIEASPRGQAVILGEWYVETFKTDVIFVIGNVII